MTAKCPRCEAPLDLRAGKTTSCRECGWISGVRPR